MAYIFRERKQHVYADLNSEESDSDSQDKDYTQSRPRRAALRRNAMSSNASIMEDGSVGLGSNSNASNRRGQPVRRSQTSRIRANDERITTTSELGQDGSVDLGSNSNACNNGQPARRIRTSRKRANDERITTTSELGQSSSMERESYLPECTNPCIENNLIVLDEQNPNMKKVPSLPEGTSSCKNTILSWLIDHKLIEESDQVFYDNLKTESTTKRGRVTRDGILCNCCEKEMSLLAFEEHANSSLKQPYDYIFLVNKRKCLLDLLTVAWHEIDEELKRQEESNFFIPNRSSINHNSGGCSICGDEGDLFCCKKCPSTFHPHCMNIERAPNSDWLCPYCICKYCGQSGETKQFVTCWLCDISLDWNCFNEFSKESDIKYSRFYCSQSCKEIYDHLEGLIALRTGISESYSWRVIHPVDMTSKKTESRTKYKENNLKVAVALTLMKESFQTMTDRQTGIDVIQNVLYSCRSKLARLNFSRFYTFILEIEDAIVAAASIRIHGTTVAEMPFIVTENKCRGRGICRKLMTVIETFLCNLKVQNLVITSVRDTLEMWKHKFGFQELSREFKTELTSYKILTFPNAFKLYKDLSTLTTRPDGDQGTQTEHRNDQETQTNQANRKSLDLNVEDSEAD